MNLGTEKLKKLMLDNKWTYEDVVQKLKGFNPSSTVTHPDSSDVSNSVVNGTSQLNTTTTDSIPGNNKEMCRTEINGSNTEVLEVTVNLLDDEIDVSYEDDTDTSVLSEQDDSCSNTAPAVKENHIQEEPNNENQVLENSSSTETLSNKGEQTLDNFKSNRQLDIKSDSKPLIQSVCNEQPDENLTNKIKQQLSILRNRKPKNAGVPLVNLEQTGDQEAEAVSQKNATTTLQSESNKNNSQAQPLVDFTLNNIMDMDTTLNSKQNKESNIVVRMDDSTIKEDVVQNNSFALEQTREIVVASIEESAARLLSQNNEKFIDKTLNSKQERESIIDAEIDDSTINEDVAQNKSFGSEQTTEIVDAAIKESSDILPSHNNQKYIDTTLNSNHNKESIIDVQIADSTIDEAVAQNNSFSLESTTELFDAPTKESAASLPMPNNEKFIDIANCPIIFKNDVSESTSVFTSKNLDTYLSNDADVQTSYKIPKLEAEGIGFSSIDTDSSTSLLYKKTNSQKYVDILYPTEDDVTLEKLCKAKTLLEKRNLNEPSEVINPGKEICHQMHSNLISGKVSFTRRCYRASAICSAALSYIIYNRRKIRVVSKIKQRIIAKIPTIHCPILNAQQNKDSLPEINKRPSLLNYLNSTTKLDMNTTNYECKNFKLPLVSLDIVPEIGKPLNPRFENLIMIGPKLDEKMVEYALTALKTNGNCSETKLFSFPICFKNNQVSVSLKVNERNENPRCYASNADIYKVATEVINGLLDYVEISIDSKKDLFPQNFDPDNESLGVDLDEPGPCDALSLPKNQKTGGHKRRVGGVNLEIKRLNCSLLSIASNEKKIEEKFAQKCTKKHCQLGCVCESINHISEKLLLAHCGKVECMFNCVCGFFQKTTDNTVVLPDGLNLSSGRVLTQLDADAKRGLAKVEKEFSQTFIRADDRLIMMGKANNGRRQSKIPKRFEDYVSHDASGCIDEYSDENITLSDKSDSSNNFCKQGLPRCAIRLDKIDLSMLIPFCMTHSLYNCYCKYEMVNDNDGRDIIGYTEYSPFQPVQLTQQTQVIKSIQEVPRIVLESSARTTGLTDNHYITRNKSSEYKKHLLKNIRNCNKALDYYLLKNADAIRTAVFQDPRIRKKHQKPLKINRSQGRKQQFLQYTYNDDIEVDNIILNMNQNKGLLNLSLQRLFKQTEHIKPELLKAIQNDRGAKQYGILKWHILRHNFRQCIIQVWYCSSKNHPGLVMTTGARPSNIYFNIRQLKHKGSVVNQLIVQALLNDTVPEGKVEDGLSIIMAFFHDYWEICGLCEKTDEISDNIQESLPSYTNDISMRDVVPKIVDVSSQGLAIDTSELGTINTNDEENCDELLSNSTQDLSQYDSLKPSSDVLPLHNSEKEINNDLILKNFTEKKHTLLISVFQYSPRKLVEMPYDTEIHQVLWACLPSISGHKWRVVYVNTEFDYLYFSNSLYNIKYNDILEAIRSAKNERTTVHLKSEEIKPNHNKFGLYCVKNYADKVFVGPYLSEDEDDLVALKIVDGHLIHTELLKHNKDPIWLVEADSKNDEVDDVILIDKLPPVIDLTSDSDGESKKEPAPTFIIKSKSKKRDIGKQLEYPNNKRCRMSVDAVDFENEIVDDDIQFIGSTSLIDHEYFIVCDIPNIGYISARQNLQSKIIRVKCPLTDKNRTFPNEKIALASITRFLERRLFKVSDGFRIKLRLINRFENSGNSPLKKSILDGFHVIGRFGVLNLRRYSPEDFKALSLSDRELQFIEARYESLRMPEAKKEMAALLDFDCDSLTIQPNVIATKAYEEIVTLVKIHCSLGKEQHELNEKRESLIQKCRELWTDLPSNDKNAFKQIFGDSDIFGATDVRNEKIVLHRPLSTIPIVNNKLVRNNTVVAVPSNTLHSHIKCATPSSPHKNLRDLPVPIIKGGNLNPINNKISVKNYQTIVTIQNSRFVSTTTAPGRLPTRNILRTNPIITAQLSSSNNTSNTPIAGIPGKSILKSTQDTGPSIIPTNTTERATLVLENGKTLPVKLNIPSGVIKKIPNKTVSVFANSNNPNASRKLFSVNYNNIKITNKFQELVQSPSIKRIAPKKIKMPKSRNQFGDSHPKQ